MMEALFQSGLVADLILAVIALEALAIAACRRLLGTGPRLARLLPTLVSGACLLLALRAALIGAAWTGIAPWLVAALVAHAVDLRLRWHS